MRSKKEVQSAILGLRAQIESLDDTMAKGQADGIDEASSRALVLARMFDVAKLEVLEWALAADEKC